MARIDRRVSPNQLSLWTVAELINWRPSVIARRSATRWSKHGERRGWLGVLLHVIAAVFARGRQSTAIPAPCPRRAPDVGQRRSTAVNHGSSEGNSRSRPGELTCGKGRPGRVARAGVEPATFRFSGGRSYQLSYLAGTCRPGMAGRVATQTGLEPATFAVTGRRANQLRHWALLVSCRAPNGVRTRATALKGRRPRPLDDGSPIGWRTDRPRSNGCRWEHGKHRALGGGPTKRVTYPYRYRRNARSSPIGNGSPHLVPLSVPDVASIMRLSTPNWRCAVDVRDQAQHVQQLPAVLGITRVPGHRQACPPYLVGRDPSRFAGAL